MEYDLYALELEVKQVADEGGADGPDLSRISALILGRLGCATATLAYDKLYADWKALPKGTMRSGTTAGQILTVLPWLRLDQPVTDRRREAELWREAKESGPRDPRWQAKIIAGSSLFQVRQTTDPAQLEEDLARIEEARALLPPGDSVRRALDVAHAVVRATLAQIAGGDEDLDAAVEEMARVAAAPELNEEARTVMAVNLALLRVNQAIRRWDEHALADQIQVLQDALTHFSADHVDRPTMEMQLEAARIQLTGIRAHRTGRFEPAAEGAGTGTPVHEIRRQTAALPDNARADKLAEAGFIGGVRAMMARDYEASIEALDLRADALDLLEPDDDRWIRNAGGLGVGHSLLTAWEIAPPEHRSHHLDQGIAWLRHTLRMTGGPHHPLWGPTGMYLARAYRLRGDALAMDPRARRLNHDAARRVGLDSLRAAAWSVLLQSGTAHAADTARMAGDDAVEVAEWCLQDGAHADAVRALDAGRGLILHVATVAATVPDMLGALGRPELADEWRAAGDVGPALREEAMLSGQAPVSGPSSRLRRRVLEALAASPLRQRLLNVPSSEEIGGALRALGATALVYLMPGEGQQAMTIRGGCNFGTALLVSRDGTTRAIDLPLLTRDAPELAAYRAVGAPGRDAGGPPTTSAPAPPRTDEARAVLERLCDWAGTAVMQPLLGHLPRRFGQVPSVVLVPMAELGAVPWHAALVSGRRRPRGRACQAAEISYAPSARLLCDVAARPAAGTRQALVVGNPTRDLHHAGEEAEAIHRTFHPDGDLLGPGTATPAAVTGWLRRQRGGLLHLACHGVITQGERHSSHLALSGGQLTAEELTQGTARYPQLDTVVLAACRTNVSGRGYDEAYSLATAFLVAGARSVLGSLWPVPDEATSLLMYMTHHYMSRDGLPPGRALRGAQLWMLDDRREPPPGMPPHLAARVPLIRSDDLTGWAGFTHLGW